MAVLRLAPAVAFVVLWAAMGIAFLAASVVPMKYAIGTMSGISAIAYYGYPYGVTLGLRRLRKASRSSHLLTGCFLIVVAWLLVGDAAARTMDPEGGSLLRMASTLLGLPAVVFLLWSAAREIVDQEEGSQASADRCVGLFLLLFFLPLGIWFVQSRVRLLYERSIGAPMPH